MTTEDLRHYIINELVSPQSSGRTSYSENCSEFLVFNRGEFPALLDSHSNSYLSSVIIPIPQRRLNTYNVRSFETLLRTVRNNYRGICIKIKYSENEYYYCMYNIVMDSLRNPLLIFTKDSDKKTFTVLVSRRVFSNPKGFLEKGIINKLIPAFSSSSVNSYYYDGYEVIVRIEDLDRFHISSTEPYDMDMEVTNTSIQRFLAVHMDSLQAWIRNGRAI